MKSIFLALALIATGVHAAEESDDNPCDKVENEVQTLECSVYSRTAAAPFSSEASSNGANSGSCAGP